MRRRAGEQASPSEATSTSDIRGLPPDHLFDATGALRRINILPRPTESGEYREVWDSAASVIETAYSMVDGSRDEEELRASGGRMALSLVRGLGIRPNHRVLEVGCGVARIGRELAPHCGEWHGVDISPNMIAIAKARTAALSNVRLQPLPDSTLSIYPDATFDRVYSHIVLFHLDKEDMLTYISEFYRVLKPGGFVYFDTWNLAHPFGWQRFLHERELNRRLSPRPPNRNRFSTPEEVAIYAQGLGLGVVEVLTGSSLAQVIAVRPDAGELASGAAMLAKSKLGAEIDALRPTSAPAEAIPDVSDAILTMDEPTPGDVLSGQVALRGWALHPRKIDDPAWGEVAVFCVSALLQREGETPREIGFAQHNLPRPDVAEAFGEPRFHNTGWHLDWDSATVENGTYTLWIEAHLTCGYRHVSIPVQVAN
jgi:SAM-dependent methyltransferase